MYRINSETGYFHPVVQTLAEGIRGEAQAIEFYTRLAQAAPAEAIRRDLEHALEDEKIHLREFSELHVRLTARPPVHRFEPVVLHSFQAGLELAFDTELEAYESYRNAYLLTRDADVRDVFFRAMTDEMEHAVRFGRWLRERSR